MENVRRLDGECKEIMIHPVKIRFLLQIILELERKLANKLRILLCYMVHSEMEDTLYCGHVKLVLFVKYRICRARNNTC